MSAWRTCVAALVAAPLLAAAGPQMPGRAFDGPDLPSRALRLTEAQATFRWEEPPAKDAAPRDPRRLAVGVVRTAPKAFAGLPWQAVAQGYVSRFDVAAADARGVRVRLDLAPGSGATEDAIS